MAMLRLLQELLERNNVPYTHHSHPLAFTAREVASAEQVSEHRVAKTVIFCGDNGFGMAILPADRYVNLQELRMALGLSHVRLATERELAALFPGCELGAVPPVGKLFGLPVFVESGMAEEDTIAFNAGTHRDVVYLRFRDFEALAKPAIFHFARVMTA